MFLDKIYKYKLYVTENSQIKKEELKDPLLADEFKVQDTFLEVQNFKRILFDVNQAMVFMKYASEQPKQIEKIKTPFDDFYLEFTRPINRIISMTQFEQTNLRSLNLNAIGFNKIDDNTAKLTLFNTFSEFDTTFYSLVVIFDLNTRKIITDSDPRSVADTEASNEILNFFYWCCFYMMAKSVNIIVDGPTRQQRRYNERKNIPMPEPWHKVVVDPKIIRKRQGETGTGRTVGHRFDVIGHLRITKYNGVEEVIWVQPHQRGLKNEIYIPKTYVVEANRNVVHSAGQEKKCKN